MIPPVPVVIPLFLYGNIQYIYTIKKTSIRAHTFLIFLILLSGIFSIETPIFPVFASTPLSIAEVQREGIRANDEFVRLTNTGTETLDLTGFKVLQKIYSKTKGACSEETLVTPGRFSQKSILPNGSFLIAHPDYATFHPTDPPADLAYPTSNTLTKNTMAIILLDGKGQTVDTKILETLCEAQDMPNESPSPTISQTGNIRINEIFPDPDTPKDAGEYIELYNQGSTPVTLSGWRITDATKTGRYLFPTKSPTQDPEQESIPAHGYFLITDTDFSFSLNNGSETLSLFDSTDTMIDSVTYTKTTEGASLNWTDTGWRISKILTPRAQNILSNTLPTTKERVPKRGYRSVSGTFQAKGKDHDGDRLKYAWDFGDGHKSYLETTSHRYTKSGTYTVTLTTKDGSEETHETFSIKISKFDPPKLRITQLLPNPAGTDTAPGAEWIEIKNYSDKKVDLMGYSLATGTKKLTNHPLRSSFVIPKKSTRRLTREYALFSLPNQKGKIELRAPNGEPIHTLKYSFPSSLANNTLLRKEKGRPITIIQSPKLAQYPQEENLSGETSTPLTTDFIMPLPAPLSTTMDPALSDEQETLKNTKRFLRLTTLGTSIVIPEDITLHQETRNDIERESQLHTDPHYLAVFLTDFSTRANTELNYLLSSHRSDK